MVTAGNGCGRPFTNDVSSKRNNALSIPSQWREEFSGVVAFRLSFGG